MGMMTPTSQGELNNMIMKHHKYTPMANGSGDLLSEKVLLTSEYDWEI